MRKKKIAIVFGTRPEAIKMAPVILEFDKYQENYETCIIVTAQHREMLDQVLKVFNITPDYDLNIMEKNQTLSDITSKVLKEIETIYIKEKPDMVLVHGDTTTSFTAALAAFYQKIPIGHVEAGLRTYDKYFPFPEEANRQLIDSISDLFFVPTITTKDNLLLEGKEEKRIIITGNTAIDAIQYTKVSETNHTILDEMNLKSDRKWILLTMHRRENYGIPMENVFKAIVELVDQYTEIEVLMPVHPSPNVQNIANKLLSHHNRIHLIEPLTVDVFHQVISKSYLVLTDSGGLQEEAPALNVPVFVLRDKTERPEGLLAGTLKVIGTDKNNVIKELKELFHNKKLYDKMVNAENPFGNGKASRKIADEITKYFK